jgi:hypothetical protein
MDLKPVFFKILARWVSIMRWLIPRSNAKAGVGSKPKRPPGRLGGLFFGVQNASRE